ncbi:MAG: PorP/SprF family type IX secretion system membrane protein [Bacteroidota bacterium]|nr:PorP/SprF family type IX secretion system membrane protein [Bacteroidota bacterium]
MLKKILKTLLLFFVCTLGLFAQDVQFSMFYNVPLYLNPAFAGSRHGNRAIAHARWQWVGQNARYDTYLVSFDTYSMKYNSGVGGYIMQDYQSLNKIVNTSVMLQYAYELKIDSRQTVRFGLQGGFTQPAISVQDGLPSQYNNDGRFDNSAKNFQAAIVPDISSGVIYYAKSLYVSLSAHHMNIPKYSVLNSNSSVLPLKMTLTAGYKIPIVINRDNEGLHTGNFIMMALTPTMTYKRQADHFLLKASDQVDLGLYWTYKWSIAGIWYRGIPFEGVSTIAPSNNSANTGTNTTQTSSNTTYRNNESIVFLVGTSLFGIGFGYSYDLTISSQGLSTGGAHEIHLSYVFRTKHTKKPMRSLPCPDFEYDILQRGSAGRVK